MSDTIAERIGKLLAKAGSTDSVHEAETLQAKAEELMVRWGIEKAVALKAAGSDVPPEQIIKVTIDMRAPVQPPKVWVPSGKDDTYTCTGCDETLSVSKFPTTKNALRRESECRACRDKRIAARQRRTESDRYNRAHIEGWFRVTRALGVDGYRNGDVLFTVVGFESDAKHAALMLKSLKAQAMLAMWSWWLSAGRAATTGDTFAARRDFVYSFYLGVAYRLEQRTKVEVDATPGAALALRDKAAELRAHMDAMSLGAGRKVTLNGHRDGFSAGMAAVVDNGVGGDRTAAIGG
jgi:Protein of unknown function (DUF2786)